MRYQVGDLVQLTSIWNNHYGLILEVSCDDIYNQYDAYLVLIQGDGKPGWLSVSSILRKIKNV